jgi:hypothetical protein
MRLSTSRVMTRVEPSGRIRVIRTAVPWAVSVNPPAFVTRSRTLIVDSMGRAIASRVLHLALDRDLARGVVLDRDGHRGLPQVAAVDVGVLDRPLGLV